MAIDPFNQREPIILDEEQMAETIEAGPPLFFGNVQTPEQNEFIDNVLALPRGFGKSAARMVAAEIPEGLWALTDLATNLTGFQDALDPKESAFLDKLQNVRDKIGYEESVPGKLGEALGSMAAFVGTTLVTGGVAGALSGAGKAAQAAKLFQTGKLIKAAKASPATFAFMSSPGYMFAAGEQQLRMKARERAGDDIEIGDRNLALALAIPVGISEFIPIGRIFGGMKRSDVSPEEFFAYQEILKRGFRSAGEEGLQEAGAGIMQDMIEKGIYNPDAAIGETWASEFGYGAGAGAIFSLALNIANRKSRRYGESGDPDDLIKDLPAEELAEVEKQAGLDTTTEAQSELDVYLANEEVELRSDLSQPEANIPEVTPEVDTVIPVADEVVEEEPSFLRSNLSVPLGLESINALPADKRFAANRKINNIYKGEESLYAFTDQELDETINYYEDILNDQFDLRLSAPARKLAEDDFAILQAERNRRKEVTKDTLGEVIKAVDEQEEVTETTTEAAEAAPEVTVEEEVKEKTTKPKKAKPAKRIDLNQKITNPVNKKSVDVGFVDEQSARVYGDGQIQTKRLVDKKTKKVINESAAFRQNVKNNLGIGTQQYRELNNRYTDYVKKGADDAMKGNQPEFKPISFANYVNQEIGVPTQEDIVQTLKDKNISTTDSDFKKYLKQQWRVDSLDQLNALNRREVMRTMGSLPMMDQKNTPIAKAFGVQGDNLNIANKQSAIDAQANKLKNKYTTQELITLAKSSGVPDQQIYSQTEGKPFIKSDIARAIANKEVDLLTTAEEMRDRISSVVTPNVIVRKNKLSNKDKADGVVRYNIEFPDKTKIRVPVDNRLEDAQAREFAANLALEERVAELKKENEEKKAVPEASDRDYLDAVRYMLASGNNPLGILQQIAKPKYSATNRIEGETSDIPLPSLAVLREPSYLFKSGVDADNIALNLRKLTKRMFPDADVALVDRLFTPEGEKAGLTEIGAENLILISLDKKFADPTDTLYHEAFHWFTNNGFFSNEDINALRENESVIRNIADARMGQPVESFEEAAAIASGAYNNAKINGQTPYEFLPPIRRVFDKLYRFFSKFKQFLNGKKYRTPEDVFDRMREGDLFKEMSENQVPLNEVNESFVKENFQRFGDVGKYEGGQMIQQTIPQYQYLQGMQPFWVNSKSFERPANFMFDSTNLRIFQNDALLERIEGLKTKKTKASEWIRQIFPTKRPIKQAYDQDVGLKDWLENQKDESVSKQDIIDYYNANADMYSIVVSGKDLDFFPVVNADERIAYQEVNNEISLLQHLTQKNNDQIRMLAIENTRFYRALKANFYDGPNTPLDTAFYSGVQTDKVINAWKKETRGKDFPLDVNNKDFDHLRKAFNSDIANYDFQTNPEMQDKTAKIVEKMLNPFVKTKELEGGWSIAVADVKDTDLAKFLSDLQSASELYIDKDGEVQVTYVHVNHDTVLDYINKFSTPVEIENFVIENRLAQADGSLYNYGQLLKDNLYLQEKYKLFDDLRSNPEFLDTSAGLEITYQKFNSLQANPDYGNVPVTSITAIDSIFGPMQRMAIRQAAKMKGQDLPKKTRELAELSGDAFETPILASPSEFNLAGDIPTQVISDIEKLSPDEREAFMLSWNNLRTDDYSIIRFIHTPSDLSQQPYMNRQHFNAIPGAFAHARIRNIYLPDGKRILFIEEIQSDYLNDLKEALNSKFKGRELKDVSAEEIDQAFKDGLLLDIGGEKREQKNIQQIPLLKLADGKPDFTNSYQDMITRAITKIALDNHYDGMATINENLQAERITESITDYFDNLYYMASVNPYDIELKEVDGNRFFYHKPSGQSVSVDELSQSDFFTPADQVGKSNDMNSRSRSGFMAAANLFAQRFSRNPESYEHNTYVRYARLIGMQGANVATDMAVPTDLSVIQANPEGADNAIMHHEGTTHLNIFNNPLVANHFKSFKGRVAGDQRNNIKTLGSFLPKSNNPSSPSFGDIINEQIRLGITPDFKRANVSSLSGNEVIIDETIREVDKPSSMTGFDPNRLLYQQDNLQGIGNGYFNLRSISPELVRGFMKQGFTQYGDPMFSRLQKALNVVDNGKGYSIAGKTKNEIAAELFDGAKIKDINSNDWWANRLFDTVYDELSQPEQNQVAMAKMQAQMEVNSKFGVKPAAKEWQGRTDFEVQGDRFRFPTIIFDEGFTDQFGSQKGGAPFAKYSSTPADAQRANTVMNILDKGRNMTKYFSGIGQLPNYLKYLKERYLTFGRMGQAEDAAKFLYNEIGAIVNPTKGKDTPEKQQLRRELTEFMEAGWEASPEMISDPKLRKLAIKAKTMIDNVGRLLVNKGLLPRDVYEKNRGAYLPRLYMKHILNSPNGNPLAYTRKRKDLDTETRLMLGDIADISPEFRIYAGITRPLRDIAMLDFFETVSNQQGWAIKDNDIMVQVPTPDGKPMNVSALWLREEADRLREQATIFENSEPDSAAQMKEKAAEFEALALPALERTGNAADANVPQGFRRIPKTRKYGMLQGVAVRKEIYNDIIGTFTIGDTDNFYNKAIAAMKKGVNIWKTLKVPLNPPTVVRNVGSNMILMNVVGGVPIHKVLPRMKQAIDQIRNDGDAWKIAKKFGIKSTGFSEQELYQTSEEMLDLMQQQHELGDITKFFALPKILGQKILKKGGDLYQFTESVGKTAIIIDAMDKGMGEFEAFHLAQKALFDYSDLPAGGKAFRSAPIGMPFFTFYYKAFPALIEVALTNPMRFAPYVALTAGLSALTGFAFGFEDDDDKKLKKSLEPWIERRTGVHVLPWKDSDGRFQFIDIGFFFPWTMYADAVKGAYNGEFMELQRTTGLFSGPFSDILLAMKTNRDPFTQRVIWDERDPVEERVKSLMWYTYGLGMPSWLTPNGAISKTVRALQDTPRPTGQPADTVPQALLRFVGVNVYGLEPRETRQRNIKRMRQDIEDTRSRMRWTMRNQSLDQETKNARRAKYLSLIRQKQQEMAQYMHDTSLPEGLLNRKSRFQD